MSTIGSQHLSREHRRDSVQVVALEALLFTDGKQQKVVRRTYATSFVRGSYPTIVSPGRHFAHEAVRRRTG